MNPKEFQVLAAELLKGGKPAHCRSAISRAYYAAIHVAAAIFQGHGLPVPKGPQIHSEIPRWLIECGDAEVAKAGSELRDFKGARNKADYDLQNARFEMVPTATLYVALSAQIIAVLENKLLGADGKRIIEGIRAYLKKIGAQAP